MTMSSNPPQPRLSAAYIDVLDKFDKEIAELEAKLLALKRTRNDHTAVSRLHPEILQEIFGFTHSLSARKWEATLVITWVCNRWRQLAQDTSSLWSYIDSANRGWINVALSRSKNRGLEFIYHDLQLGNDVPSQQGKHLVLLALENLSRTRGLYLTAEYVEEYPASLLNAPEWMKAAPILETLNLEQMCLPPNVFSGIYPSLRTLSLDSCQVDWNTFPVVSGLRELTIIEPDTQCSIEKLIQILGVVQQDLRILTLHQVVDSDATIGDVCSHRVSLPSLEECHLDEELEHSITPFLQCISFPPHAQIVLWPSSGHQNEMGILSELIAARNIEKWPVSYVCFGVSVSQYCFELHIVEDWDNRYGNDKDHEGGSIALNLPFDDEHPSVETISLLKMLPIHPIRNLVIRDFDAQDTGILTYLADLGTIQELSVSKRVMEVFLRFVQEQTARVNADLEGVVARTPIPFLNLQKLTFTGNLHSRLGDNLVGRKELESLQTSLRWRQLSGFPLNVLVLRKMMVPSISWVEDLLGDVVQELRMEDVVEGGS